MRYKVAALAALLACGLVSSAQDTKDWKYVSKEGGYSIRFPRWAQAKTVAKESPDGVKATLTIATAPGKDLRVLCSITPEVFPAEDIFAGAAARAKQGDSKLVRDEPVSLGAEKYPGREIVSETGGRFNRSRVFVAGDKVYAISANGPKDFISGKEAEDFFRSFAITPTEQPKTKK